MRQNSMLNPTCVLLKVPKLYLQVSIPLGLGPCMVTMVVVSISMTVSVLDTFTKIRMGRHLDSRQLMRSVFRCCLGCVGMSGPVRPAHLLWG